MMVQGFEAGWFFGHFQNWEETMGFHLLVVPKSWQEPELFLPLPEHMLYTQGSIFYQSPYFCSITDLFPGLNLHFCFRKHSNLDFWKTSIIHKMTCANELPKINHPRFNLYSIIHSPIYQCLHVLKRDLSTYQSCFLGNTKETFCSKFFILAFINA